MVLTSRNWIPPLRRVGRAHARPREVLVGGGCNAILVRGEAIAEHRAEHLRRRPERRVVHGCASGTASGSRTSTRRCGRSCSRGRTSARAAATALAWAGDAPLVLGGDFNLRDPAAAGLRDAGGNWVDHVLVRGMQPQGRRELPDRGGLSDHKPVIVEVA